VARGGIEPPTQGFQLSAKANFRYQFQGALAPQSQLAQKIVCPSLIGQAPWLLLSITDIRLMPSKQKNTYITGAMTQVINNKSQYNKCT